MRLTPPHQVEVHRAAEGVGAMAVTPSIIGTTVTIIAAAVTIIAADTASPTGGTTSLGGTSLGGTIAVRCRTTWSV